MRSASPSNEALGRSPRENKQFIRDYLQALQELSFTYFAARDFETATTTANHLIELVQSHLGEGYSEYIWEIVTLGTANYRIGNFDVAETIMECATKLGREHLVRDKKYIVLPWNLAFTKMKLRRLDEAKGLVIECIEIMRTFPDINVITMAEAEDLQMDIQAMEEEVRP